MDQFVHYFKGNLWHIYPSVCMYMYIYICVCVHMCLNNGNKHCPFCFLFFNRPSLSCLRVSRTWLRTSSWPRRLALLFQLVAFFCSLCAQCKQSYNPPYPPMESTAPITLGSWYCTLQSSVGGWSAYERALTDTFMSAAIYSILKQIQSPLFHTVCNHRSTARTRLITVSDRAVLSYFSVSGCLKLDKSCKTNEVPFP